MSEPYGMPPGTAINYGARGFPAWIDRLCSQWGLDSSTYPGHQESDRPDIGAAPNPNRENRGVDWAGPPDKMLAFAKWCVSTGPDRTPGQYGPRGTEMVIYQDPRTGERVWYPDFVDYGGDFSGHTDHVHTRQSAALIDYTAPPSPKDRYAQAIIAEGQRRGITPRGIKIALAVALVETNLTMYANVNVPASLAIPHDAIGSDHDSTGLFQQRQAWGSLEDTMDPTRSAGLFYGGGKAGQRGLTAFDYNNEANPPGFYGQAVQVSAFPDRYDQRYAEAEQIYDRLAAAPVEEDWMANPELERMIREIHGAWFNRLPSKSRYADPNQVWGNNEYLHNVDGHVFDLICEHNAALGDEWSLSQVRVAAAKGDKIAEAFLQRLTTAQTTTPTQPTPAVSPPAPQQPTPQPQPSVVYLPAPNTPGWPPKEESNGTATTGQLIGKAYDALEALRLADALPIEGRAPLAALIAVLQTKNGSQLNA